MRKTLTDTVINRKAEGEIWDQLLPGFGIRIGKRKRTYFVMGRLPDPKNPDRRQQVRRIVGTPNELTLAAAREKARGMLAELQKNIDPKDAERRARLEAARERRMTFASVATDFMAEEGCRRKNAREQQRKLDVEILPLIGDIPITDLRRSDVKALVLDKAAEAPVQARHLKGLISRICNYAIDEELIESNPVVRINVPTNPPRERYLSDQEIARFWNGLQFARLDDQIVRILKLLLVTGQRRNEVAHMQWSELDLEEGLWELPSGRSKSGRAHLVPLTRLARDLIGKPGDHEHVFHRPDGAIIPGNTISYAMWKRRDDLGLNDCTVHDLRRSFASGLSKLKVDRLTISKLLNHSEGGVTQRYDRYDRLEQKRIAMEAWTRHLKAVASGQPAPSNVEPLRAHHG